MRTATVGGGVKFAGSLAVCYRANLGSRIASRILWRIAEAPYATEQDIYDAAHRLPWPEHFAVDRTIRVDISAISSPVKSLEFVTLRVKDAVCDRFRADTGQPAGRRYARAGRSHPRLSRRAIGDVLPRHLGRAAVQARLARRRGRAPLRENLAAGHRRAVAAGSARAAARPDVRRRHAARRGGRDGARVAPGSRRAFAFEQLTGFDAEHGARSARTREPPRSRAGWRSTAAISRARGGESAAANRGGGSGGRHVS